MKKYWLFFVILIICNSCERTASVAILSKGDNRSVSIVRFDQELYHQLKDSSHIDYSSLKVSHPEFWNVYIESILAISDEDSASTNSQLNDFFFNPEIQALYSDVSAEFDSIDDIKDDLQKAFYSLSKYYPELKLPVFYTHLSGLNQSVVVSDNLISVSLDKYLGPDYPLYDNTIYFYERVHMKRSNIVRDYVAGWFYSEFPFNGIQYRVLDNMIYEGKLCYLYYLLFPQLDERQIMDYSKEEMDIATKFENKIWSTIISDDKLFEVDQSYTSKLVNEAPFTLFGVGTVPGRIGCLIGMHIIQSYVKNHPNLHLKDLLLENNFQQIYDESNYISRNKVQ